VGCTHWWATRDELTEQYGADAAARFFPSGELRAEVVLEVPIPIEMEPTGRRRSLRPVGGCRKSMTHGDRRLSDTTVRPYGA